MRKYEHYERLEIREVADDEMKRDYVNAALENLAFVIDSSNIIGLASASSATTEHPAWRAIVSLGELSLPFLLKRLKESDGSWEIMAVEQILNDLEMPVSFPDDHLGRIGLIRKDLLGVLRKALRKDGRLREAAAGDPKPLCACGKPGKWIADGICRTGYYCQSCSKKALENA